MVDYGVEVGPFCGSVTPDLKISSTVNFLYVEFATDPSVTGQGFEIEYHIPVPCGEIRESFNAFTKWH